MKSPTKNIQPSTSRPNGVAKYTIRKIGPTRPPHSSTINWDFRYRANIGHAPRLAGPPSRVRVAPRNTVRCDCGSVDSLSSSDRWAVASAYGQRVTSPQTLARSRWTLVAVSTALFCVQIDYFAMNLALPRMAHDLGSSATDLQWVISIYMLSLGASSVR